MTPECIVLEGPDAGLEAVLATRESDAALREAREVQSLMLPYQRHALYHLARQYDGGRILEIGCYHGASALIMALAAPEALIVTMSPDKEQVAIARRNVAGHKVVVHKARSSEYLKTDINRWDMVYVDGDHKRVRLDLVWFDRLLIGGLILFHDYTPVTAEIDIPGRKPHPAVYAAVNELGERLGREPDVRIVDQRQIGMAGFYRGKGEKWK